MRSVVACALSLAVVAALMSARAGAQRATPRPAPPAAPHRDAVVPFAPGETLTYDVSWSSILMAGTAVVTVQDKRPSFGSSAYMIVAEGRPIPLVARLYQLYYRMDTLVDSVTLLSQRGSLHAEEGKDKRTSITQFDRPGKRVLFEEQSDTTTKTQYPVPPQTQDGLSALYWLRTRTFHAGDHIVFPVADSGTLYTVDIHVGQPESVKTRSGETTAWPLTGTIKDGTGQSEWKNIGAWISVDSRRLPVKLQAELPIGAFVLALRDVR
jgi:hypothetical protein